MRKHIKYIESYQNCIVKDTPVTKTRKSVKPIVSISKTALKYTFLAYVFAVGFSIGLVQGIASGLLG